MQDLKRCPDCGFPLEISDVDVQFLMDNGTDQSEIEVACKTCGAMLVVSVEEIVRAGYTLRDRQETSSGDVDSGLVEELNLQHEDELAADEFTLEDELEVESKPAFDPLIDDLDLSLTERMDELEPLDGPVDPHHVEGDPVEMDPVDFDVDSILAETLDEVTQEREPTTPDDLDQPLPVDIAIEDESGGERSDVSFADEYADEALKAESIESSEGTFSDELVDDAIPADWKNSSDNESEFSGAEEMRGGEIESEFIEIAADDPVADENAPSVESEAVAWDAKNGEKLLKRKKEPSLLLRILPPLLGAIAALPIAVAILWYGFGTDLGNLGPMVAQYAPSIVPAPLRGSANQPIVRSTPPTPPASVGDVEDEFVLEESNGGATPMAQEELPAENGTESLDAQPESEVESHDFWDAERIRGLVDRSIASQARFKENGPRASRQERTVLASHFWEDVQLLARELSMQEPVDAAAFDREFGGWASGILSDSILSRLIPLCTSGNPPLNLPEDLQSPRVLLENAPKSNEGTVQGANHLYRGHGSVFGQPVDMIIPSDLVAKLGADSSSKNGSKAIYFGQLEQNAGRYAFRVTHAIR